MAGEKYEQLLGAWRKGREADTEYFAESTKAVEATADAIGLQLGVQRQHRVGDVVSILETGASSDAPAKPARSAVRLIKGKYEALIRIALGRPDGEDQEEHIFLPVTVERDAIHFTVEVGGVRGIMTNGAGWAATLAAVVVSKLLQQIRLGKHASDDEIDALEGVRIHYALR